MRTLPSPPPEVRREMVSLWGSTYMVLDGTKYDLTEMPCLVSEDGGTLTGFLIYDARDAVWEIMALESLVPGMGTGSQLIREIADMSKSAGAEVLMVATTNDNTSAIRFYQKRGFDLVCLRRDAVTRSRKIKPEIPETGDDGIPIRHELVLEMRFSD